MPHAPLSTSTRLATAAALALGSCLAAVLLDATPVSAAAPIAPGERRCFEVEGEPGDIAVVNLTPVEATGAGDGKLLPSGLQPSGPVANVNFAPGTVDPNVAFTKIGADGRVCFHNSNNAFVNLVADQLGTITDPVFTYRGVGEDPGGEPYRILDTRTTGAKIGPSERRCFGVPGTYSWGTILNLTPVLADGAGDGQVLVNDEDATPPIGANVNFAPGTVDPNVAVAEVGFLRDEAVCFVNSQHTSVHLIVDSLGSLPTVTMGDPNTGTMKRVLDTRTAAGGGKIGPNERRCFAVSGNPHEAAVINLTPVLADGFGDGKVVSSDVDYPVVAANVNFGPGTVDPNLAVAPIGEDGQVCYINSKHTSVHLVADHMATLTAYAPALPSGAPKRVLDTRKIPDDVGPTETTVPSPSTEPPPTPTEPPIPTEPPTPTTQPVECDPSYPTVCIPPPPPDLDCADIEYTNFVVLAPDPHRFDRDHNGIGCES